MSPWGGDWNRKQPRYGAASTAYRNWPCQFGRATSHAQHPDAVPGSGTAQFAICQPMWAVRRGTITPPAVFGILTVVAGKPHCLAVTLEGEDVGRDPVEEPAVVRD